MPKTNRVILIDIELWNKALVKAKEEGFSLSALIRLFLKEYVENDLSFNIKKDNR